MIAGVGVHFEAIYLAAVRSTAMALAVEGERGAPHRR
jgi:hypothetical protein